jgi:GTP-binding protein HflX
LDYFTSKAVEDYLEHKTVTVEDRPPRAFLVSLDSDPPSPQGDSSAAGINETASLARELRGLVHSLGLEIAAHEMVKVREYSSKYGMGTGKAQELAEKAGELQADCMIVDWDPSPSQQRNWETLSGIPMVDRQELIIKIFADRASTREAELQVRLAELSYSLPRLSHKYIDLSRQRGGRYGTRGSGETRLELDRRQVEQRIQQLREELKEVRRQRQLQRRQRRRQGIFVCALVGYTNAGKSSLMNALTGADLAAEDRLFVTLDAVSRRFELSKGLPVILVDTVGFIRNLPHTLVNAFHSTLEEAALANLLIHVADASDPDMENCRQTTLQVLQSLGAGDIPMITVLNKIDKLPMDHEGGSLPPRSVVLGPNPRFDPAVYSATLLPKGQGSTEDAGTFATVPDTVPIPISVRRGWGLEELKERMRELLSGTKVCFYFSSDRGDLVSLLHRRGRVLSESWEDGGIRVEAWVDGRLAGQLRQYLV